MSTSPPQTSLASDAYSGLATYGRIRTYIGVAIGFIIGLILLVLGFRRTRDKHTGGATATVTAVTGCRTVPGGTVNGQSVPQQRCTVNVSFAVGSKSYVVHNLSVTRLVAPKVGTSVHVQYVPANPYDALIEASPKTTGYLMMAGGVAVVLFSAALAYFAHTSKAFAAFEGVAGVARML